MAEVSYYGIKHVNPAKDDIDRHIESLHLLGYAVVPGPWNERELANFSDRLDRLYERQANALGGHEVMKSIGEAHTVRLPLAEDEVFLAFATNPTILEIARRMMDGYVILNQQNATINMPDDAHSQSSFHRDLPYQHFTTSAPLAINAIICLDPFRPDNGATWVVPASQHWDICASMETMKRLAVQIAAPAGSYIVMNSMNFHAAGQNHSNAPRRGINNVYVRPFMRQQIDIPVALGGRYKDDPELAQLLGYKDKPPANAAEWRRIYIDRLKAKKK